MDRDHSPAFRRSLLALLFVAASAEAQFISTVPRFDFSFSNPGARSLGFGGAFAALADDATAAYANPAGLVQLVEPEVSLEGRQWNRSTSFLAGGRENGEPTGIGLDTREGLLWGRDRRQELAPSFASVVIPKGRWSFALYGHQLAKFETSTESQGVFFEEEDDGSFSIPPEPRSWGTRDTVDLAVATVGMAAAWRMNDQVSFGLGIVVSEASLETRLNAFVPDDDSEESLFGELSFLPERRAIGSRLSIDGTDVTFNAGVLGRLSEQLSAGLFYRQGAKVEGTIDYEIGPGPLFPGAPPFTDTFHGGAVFQVPDVLGAGLAWRSKGGRVTLATEVDRVGYESFVYFTGDNEGGMGIEDAWEYHLGGEYALLQSTPILAFRAGTWIEAYGDDLQNESLTHLTAGIGIAAHSYQIALAADFSDEVDTTSLSFIYNF